MFHLKDKLLRVFCIISATLTLWACQTVYVAYAMPFYDLRPAELTLRAEFYTSYTSSSAERKNNIALATKSINGTLVDVGAEFSFNRTVGARTLKRGYKNAKIIVDGKFVDGVGGGVCQVSTTLYNAVILAGLEINEYHPHSLPVSYVAPSFDAMVNSGSADLRFTNNTHNPLLIYATADGSTLKITVWGEPMREKYLRQSVVKEYISPTYQTLTDVDGEYPDLYEGEQRIVSYGKQGLISEGSLIKKVNGKIVSVKKLRTDKYRAINGVTIIGTTPRPAPDLQPNLPDQTLLDLSNIT